MQPQKLRFEDFSKRTEIVSITGIPRAGVILFDGQEIGFVDALGELGKKQAHKREIQNSLYINSSEDWLSIPNELPSIDALMEYPELIDQFPNAANKVLTPKSTVSSTWVNYYVCDCGEEWEDMNDCCCNDHCPRCDKEITPYISDDGSLSPEDIANALFTAKNS